MRRASFLLFLLSAPATALADTGKIGPSFACPRPAPADGLSQMICNNSDMSREEVVFEQAYYALRYFHGRGDWKALKAQAVTFNTTLRTQCGIPLAGASDQTMPAGAAACYIDQTEKDRDTWLQQLTGGAREEASRPIEQHIALQQRLVDLGYLPTGTKADGIYGEGTREAIGAWQRATGRPQATGFLSNDDAPALLASTVRTPTPGASDELAEGGSGLHTSTDVLACANPRAVRALNNKADPRQNDPGWIAFVKKDGECFLRVRRTSSGSRSRSRAGLLLLRRSPPVVAASRRCSSCPAISSRPLRLRRRRRACHLNRMQAAPCRNQRRPSPHPTLLPFRTWQLMHSHRSLSQRRRHLRWAGNTRMLKRAHRLHNRVAVQEG